MDDENKSLLRENQELKAHLNKIKKIYSIVSSEMLNHTLSAKNFTEILLEIDNHGLDQRQIDDIQRIRRNIDYLDYFRRIIIDLTEYGVVKRSAAKIYSLADFLESFMSFLQSAEYLEHLQDLYLRGLELISFLEDENGEECDVGRYGLHIDLQALGIGLDGIFCDLLEINPTSPVKILFLAESDLLSIESSTALPKCDTPQNIRFINSYLEGFEDLAAKTIFELYGGRLTTSKSKSRISITIELPLIVLEGADSA